jgi:transaldolase/glucose-6-phosphate isomerase
MNRLRTLADLGQSIWLDYIRRDLLLSGELHRLVTEDGVGGITSNPAIFEKAIAQSPHYAPSLRALLGQADLDAQRLYEIVAVRDIQDAADVLSPVYEKSGRADGYVSLEVSPYLAGNSQATLEEARRLKRLVGRPNLLVKIPATPEGIPAIRQALSEGISINITLLFSQQAYEKVAQAYLEGLETYAAAGGDVSKVASVASFFISRIDSLADALIQKKIDAGATGADRKRLESLLGKVAIANGRMTYQRFKAIFSGPRWQALAAKGARPQRVLWASTSTKNPKYRDVLYVEELIGRDTVNTLPPQTLEAFRDHGEARASLEEGVDRAAATLADLETAGLSLKEITDRVLDDGVRLFSDAFDTLLGAVERKRRELLGPALSRQTVSLPQPLAKEVAAVMEDWRAHGKVRRLWARDATLWTGADEGRWLGWLDVAKGLSREPAHLHMAARIAREGGFTHALLLGMGGSSLAPDVLRRTFGRVAGFPEFQVLDSTDPAQVLAAEARIDIAKTLFIVSSKSGTTLEPNILCAYFLDRVRQAVGPEQAAQHFIAITDPGSSLEQQALRERFRAVAHGLPSIGGRYSALSNFGMVPAAVMGIDVDRILERALSVARSCAATVPAGDNPGVLLGAVLGVLARNGRDKVTLVASPAIGAFGAWLEQLLAESTGKSGKGIIPVDRETPRPLAEFGSDRLFIHLRLATAPDAAQDQAMAALKDAGQPVVSIDLPAAYDLGGEFFRWEIATAVAGSVLGINPFDQPDVEASKDATRALTAEYEKTGALPAEKPFAEGAGLRLFADDRNTRAILDAAGARPTAAACLKAHLGRLVPGDYCALLAYVEMTGAAEEALQSMRHRVRAAKRVATCVGFGPRFLHSTGQAYKGGPPTGVFLQITCDDARDVAIPGRRFTFGLVKAAQARGDFEVLTQRGRRALRVHLGADLGAGLAALAAAIDEALR